MKLSGLGPRDAPAAGQLHGEDGLGRRALKKRAGAAEAAAPGRRGAEGAWSLRPCAALGGSAAVSVRRPCACPRARARGVGAAGPACASLR